MSPRVSSARRHRVSRLPQGACCYDERGTGDRAHQVLALFQGQYEDRAYISGGEIRSAQPTHPDADMDREDSDKTATLSDTPSPMEPFLSVCM